jgi:predicted phage terminase large subunit-like protein
LTGAITIRPTPKQRQAKKIVDTNTITFYGGAIRGGKSYFLFLTFITYCFKFPKSRWLILRESMPTMKRNLFPTFQSILDMGIGQYVKEWNRETQTVTFTNGSQILFMEESYDRDKELNRFRGLEINGAGIDEVNEIQEQTFFKIVERSGSWKTKAPIKIIATCNPANNWVRERVYEKWKTNTLQKGWAYVPAKITDNPHISAEYLENLKTNLPAIEYQRFVEGDWDVSVEGVLFARTDLKRFSMKGYKKDAKEATLGYADIADEGDDYFSMPMADIFPKKIFITDVLFTKDNVDITLPLAAGLINKNNPEYVRIESNNQGSVFVKMLRQQVPIEKILTLNNSTNKHTRILLQYGFIKEYCYFLDESEIIQGSPYDLFMRQIFGYMKDGSSKHDDAPDSLSGLSLFIQGFLPHLFR